ncbi:MAG: HD domain-containing phosphohydrolase [Roseibium sp.]
MSFENRNIIDDFERILEERPVLALFDVVSWDTDVCAKIKKIVKGLRTSKIVAMFDHNHKEKCAFWASLGVQDTFHKTSPQDELLTLISNCTPENARDFVKSEERAPEKVLGIAESAFEDMSATMLGERDLNTKSTTAAATFINALLGEGRELEWLSQVEQHHSPTMQHSLEVANIMYRFAGLLGIEEDEKLILTKMALVHDIGKLRVPLSILDKPDKLTHSEIDFIKRHSEIGAEFLREKGWFSDQILMGVRSHHEYLDGSGYPDGLTADQIPQFVRMLTISDIFAALTEKRAYKAPYSPRVAVTIMWDMKGKLDTKLLPIFNRDFARSDFTKAVSGGRNRI